MADRERYSGEFDNRTVRPVAAPAGMPDRTLAQPVGRPEDNHVGAELRIARQRLGVDLETAARDLKIRADYLDGLERNDHAALPGLPYATGFVRSYAAYLGLDAARLAGRFREETTQAPVRQDYTWLTPIERGRFSGGPVLLLSLALAGAAYAGWYYLTAEDRQPAAPVEIAGRPGAAPEARTGPAIDRAADAQAETAGDAAADGAAGAAADSAGVSPDERADSAAAGPPAGEAPAVPPVPPVPAPDAAGAAADSAGVSPDESAGSAAAGPPAGEVPTAPPVPPAPAPDAAGAAADSAGASASEEAGRAAAGPPAGEAPATPPGPPAPAPDAAGTDNADNAAARPAAPGPAETAGGAGDPAPAAGPPDPDPAAPQSAAADRTIVLRARGLVWIRVRHPQTRQIVIEGIMKEGNTVTVPDDPELVLDVGRASELEYLVGGVSAGFAGPVQAPRYDLSLDPARLIRRRTGGAAGEAPAAEPPAAEPPAAEPPTAEAPAPEREAPSASASPPAAAASPPPAAAASPPPATAASPPPPAAAAGAIVLRAHDQVWIRVRDPATGRVVVEGIMNPGNTFAVPDDPGLVLDVGRASELEYLVGGVSAGRAGESPVVVHNLPLDRVRRQQGE